MLDQQRSLTLLPMADEQFEYQQKRLDNIRIKDDENGGPSYFNVVICGDYGVGKTTLIQQFCGCARLKNMIPHSVHYTKFQDVCGRKCAFKLIEVWSSAITSLEMSKHMGRYRDMDAIDALILIYDPSSRHSFLSLRDVHFLAIEIPGLERQVPVTLLANNAKHLPETEWTVSFEEAEAFARGINAGFDILHAAAATNTTTTITTQQTAAAAVASTTTTTNDYEDKEEKERSDDTNRVKMLMWNAMKGPAEWRVLAEMEREEDREARIGQAKDRLAKVAPRKGNRLQMALGRIRKMGLKRLATTTTVSAAGTGGGGGRSAGGGGGGNGREEEFMRLPARSPTVDTTWDEWILGRR